MRAFCHLAGIDENVRPRSPDGIAVSGIVVGVAFGALGRAHVGLGREIAVIHPHFRTIERVYGHAIELGGDRFVLLRK